MCFETFQLTKIKYATEQRNSVAEVCWMNSIMLSLNFLVIVTSLIMINDSKNQYFSSILQRRTKVKVF